MKHIKNIIITAVWIVVGAVALTMILTHVPSVQAYIGTKAAEIIGGQLGTKVSIGRVNIGLLNRVIVDDVLIYDQQSKEMMKSARLSVKVDLPELIQGKVRITSAQVFSTHFTLYKDSAEAQPNFQFVVDALSSKDTTKTSAPLDLAVNSFIMRHCSVKYDVYNKPTSEGKLNLNHIKLSEISAYIQLHALSGDSIDAYVKKLAMEEQSGLKIDNISLSLVAGKTQGTLSDFELLMPHSRIAIGNITANYTRKATHKGDPAGWDTIDPQSLSYEGEISPSSITLADISPIQPDLKTFRSTIGLETKFNGTSDRLNIGKLNIGSTTGDINIDASGQISNWTKKPTWNVDIRDFSASAKSMEFMTRNLEGRRIDAPKIVRNLGDVNFKGRARQTYDGNIKAKGRLTTGVGYADIDISAKERNFSGHVKTSDIDLKKLTEDEKLGIVAANINVKGSIPERGNPKISADGTVDKFTYNDYDYSKIEIDGSYDGDTLEGQIAINDPNIRLVAAGSYVSEKQGKTIKLKTAVSGLCPTGAKLTGKWGDAIFGANITADFKASGVNDAEGTIEINDFAMTSSEDTCTIDNISLESGFSNGEHFLEMDGDLGYAQLKGKFNYSTLSQSITNLIGSKLPTLPGLPKTMRKNDNNFTIVAQISDTEWMKSLLDIPLTLKQPIAIRGNVEDASQKVTIDCQMPMFEYDGTQYENTSLNITSPGDSLKCEVTINRVEKKGNRAHLDIKASAVDNSLITTAAWNNNAQKDNMRGTLNAHTTFFKDENGENVALITIDPSQMEIGNKTWEIAPANVRYKTKRIEVDGLSISHENQYVNINGAASDKTTDSLKIALNGIEVKYVLDMINFHSVDFAGSAYGNAFVVAPFGKMDASGLLTVRDFEFEGGDFGVLNADVRWNTAEKQIDISGIAGDGNQHVTHIDGYVSPPRKYIDLAFKVEGTKIDFLHSFTKNFLGDISGSAYGNMSLSGPLKNMNLLGKVAVDGSALVGPTNCRYYLKGDTVYFDYNEIIFKDVPIYDTHNNKGVVNGSLRHDHLRNMSYDINVRAENMLAYDFKEFGDDSFCGTVYGTGTVDIDGRSGVLNMNIDVTPERNSIFYYNIAAEEISDQAFIQWNDRTAGRQEVEKTEDEDTDTYEFEMPSETEINFTIHCNPAAAIEIKMDNSNNDHITMRGNGDISAVYSNKNSFQMFGTYTMTEGTYEITIQEIITKKFNFNENSTISFIGNPFDATLDMEAVYTVNNVSLADLNIGSSFASQTHANCIMKIGGQAKSPQVTFDLEFPNIGTDEMNAIKTIIDGEDEKNQQVIYLLAVGRLYPQEQNNNSTQNASNQSETSLAMQSLLSGTISSQLSSVLNTMVNNNNWNIGANISTGNEGWNNAEYEGIVNGRLLNNRLLINGQFGYRDNATTSSTGFIGDFDVQYLLIPNGNLALKVYNETNDRYFTMSTLNTQGIGLIMKKDFNNFWELVGRKKDKKGETKEPETVK